MTDRDAYGRPLGPIEDMGLPARLHQLRGAVGALLADESAALRWVGASLQAWLESGRSLEVALGLSPPRGSKSTVAGRAKQAMRDRALLHFANDLHCDAWALRILRGESKCPPGFEGRRDELLALGVALGPHAVTRARRRVIGQRR